MSTSSTGYSWIEQFTTVPLWPSRKVPAVKWSQLKAGESQPDRPGETQGRAILTGHRSGGLVVIDVDAKEDEHGRSGFARLIELEKLVGPLPDTYAVDTPSHGVHLYYRSNLQFASSAKILPHIGKQGNVDVRAEGGIVVAPGFGRNYTPRDITTPIAELPEEWAEILPLYKERLEPAPVVSIVSDIAALRVKIATIAKAKKGDAWSAIRRAIAGERLFRLQDGPGPISVPIVSGVDEYISKQIIWTLASTADFYLIAPEDIAALFGPALSILREDADVVGTPSRFTEQYFAEKWRFAQEKVNAQAIQDNQILDEIHRSRVQAKTAIDHGLPWVVQLDDSYFVLDDNRDNEIIYRPCRAVSLVSLAKKIWPESRSVMVDDDSGVRRMTPVELCAEYSTPVTHRVTEYFAQIPRVDGCRLITPPNWAQLPPEPKEDPEVHEWLLGLGGDELIRWIVWANSARTERGIPALAMIGASTIGKTVFAVGVARTSGQQHPIPLRSALQKHSAQLTEGPIIFADEGMPSIEGRPATEEFRALMTASSHSVELKGVDQRLVVRGNVRVILAANRVDRLFNNPGVMNRHDVQALVRRLLVFEFNQEQEAKLKQQIVALGNYDNDPVRLNRVAGHMRYLQLTVECDPPMPRASPVAKALRLSTDVSRAAMMALEESFGSVNWIAVDENNLWVELCKWATVAEVRHTVLERQVEPYAIATKLLRTHPSTGAPLDRRTKWMCLDLSKLIVDGIEIANGS